MESHHWRGALRQRKEWLEETSKRFVEETRRDEKVERLTNADIASFSHLVRNVLEVTQLQESNQGQLGARTEGQGRWVRLNCCQVGKIDSRKVMVRWFSKDGLLVARYKKGACTLQ